MVQQLRSEISVLKAENERLRAETVRLVQKNTDLILRNEKLERVREVADDIWDAGLLDNDKTKHFDEKLAAALGDCDKEYGE
jgi:regulator of replication initiation timing